MVLDTFDDNRNAFLFGTNPRAGKFDMQIGSDGNAGNVSWDGIWFVETQITQEGWIVEMAIPFRTLRFSGDRGQVWGINFERRVRRKFEDSYWSPIPPPYRLGRVSLAGRLEGLEGIHPGRNLWLKPYVTTPILRREGDDVDFEPEVGLDVKYAVTSQLTLDLTWNTDFSQVEADEEQINLTRFSLFFPEKREFFLENASVFDWGRRQRSFRFRPDLLPFFSRRIGIASNEEGETLLVPVLGGARLTGRAGKYTLGLLAMQTGEADGIPSSNVAVMRVRRDLLSQSDVGMIYTQKADAGGGTSRTYGADLHFNFFRYLDVSTYALKTDNPGVEGKDKAANFEVSWVDELMEINVGHLRIEENFDPALGFVARGGINKSSARFELTPRPGEKIPWILEFNPSIEVDYLTNPDNLLETRRVEPRFSIIFSDSTRLSFALEDSFERLLEPFEIRKGQYIPEGDYNFLEKSMFFRSDASRKISAEVRLGSGTFYNGYRDRYGLGLTFTPSYQLSAQVSWDHNKIDLPSGAFDTNLAGLRLEYAFSNRMFFNALIQYNSERDEILSNLRFNFIHHPLSDLFVVYNERRDAEGGVIDRGFVVKLTHLFAF